MNKTEFVGKLAAISGQPKTVSEKNFNAMIATMLAVLVNGDGKVVLPGIGSLVREEVKERKGNNPRTGQPMTIPAKKRIKFKPSKTIKVDIND